MAAGLCLAVAAFLFITHHRAKAATERLKAQLRSQGEKLSISELIPPPPANGPSGSAAFLKAASQLSTISDGLLPGPMAMTKPGRARVAFAQAVLPTSESTNVWPELGAQLEELQSSVEDLNTLLAEPAFHFPVNYPQAFSTVSPHLLSLRNAVKRLSAETLFRLHKRQPAEALKALQATARIPNCLQREHILMSQILRHGFVSIAAAPTWEALQHPDWNDAQLAAIQSTWESLSILPEMAPALSMERAWVVEEFENCRESLRRFDTIWGGGTASNPLDDLADITTQTMGDAKAGVDAFLDRFPRRWVWRWWTGYPDEIWFLSWSQLHLQSARDLKSGIPYLTVKQQAEAEIDRRGETPKAFLLSRIAASGVHASFLKRAVTAEAQRRIVITAIGLKRYGQRHGTLPSGLSALVPEILSIIPLDPVDGNPLRYRRSPNGEFLLYSIGIDGTDDGGDAMPASPTAKTFYWTQCKDWVWPMPASTEDVAKYHEDLDARWRRSRK